MKNSVNYSILEVQKIFEGIQEMKLYLLFEGIFCILLLSMDSLGIFHT